MADSVALLLAGLDLERIEDNIFRGDGPHDNRRRVFGGLVVAQALVAASRTVADRAPHSLHAYFILPGDPAVPIVYQVERIRDGASFTTRRCVAIQHGRPIFSMSASFQIEEPGFDHSAAMPDVPDPDTLMSERELLANHAAALPEHLRQYLARERPIEFRPIDMARFAPPPMRGQPVVAPQRVWLRAVSKLPDDNAIHRAVLTYLTDMTLIDSALAPHGRSVFDPDIQAASLDHALWFHRPARADEWLLYAQQSPNANGARGLALGNIFTRDGQLVATVAQEGLLRPRPK